MVDFLSKPDKKRPLYQYFSKIYYNKLVCLTMGDYDTYVKNLPAREKPMHPFAWCNCAVHQAFNAAPDHIKAEVLRIKTLNEQSLEELSTNEDVNIFAQNPASSMASMSTAFVASGSSSNLLKLDDDLSKGNGDMSKGDGDVSKNSSDTSRNGGNAPGSISDIHALTGLPALTDTWSIGDVASLPAKPKDNGKASFRYVAPLNDVHHQREICS